jgi:hypothetical protein
VIALTLYMQVSYREVLRCLLEGVKWLLGPEWEVNVGGKSGISQARTRLGWKPLQQLHDEVVAPIAGKRTKVLGIVRGVRSVWMEAPWMSPTIRTRESLRPTVGEPGGQRLPASAFRILGGKRNARIVWHANEWLCRRRNHDGQQGLALTQ